MSFTISLRPYSLIIHCAIITIAFTQGPNPCHNGKSELGLGVTCEKVRIPKGLCSTCKLNPFRSDGSFVSCKEIYDLKDPACQMELKLYSQYNRHCDPVRSRLTHNFTKQNIQKLDYFVYSVCEECCDCIPKGARLGQYDYRKETGTLFNVHRGNCAAHAYYDICKIWPNIRYVTLGKEANQFWRPQICPLLADWFHSTASDNWLQKSFVPLNFRIKEFLDQFVNVARCHSRPMWERCNALERSQKRL